MAAKKRRKGTKARGRRGGRRHSNPHRSMHRRRSNPGMLTGATSILKDGFYALVGLVVSRQLPQMVLGTKNTGVIGYAANFAATLVAAMVGAKFLGKEAGKMIGVGGGIYTVNRVIQDQFSPIGQVLSLSGIGDYTALGDIQPGYFPLPVPTDAQGRPIIPMEIRPTPAPAMAMRGGMGSVSSPSRYASRF